MKRPSRTSNDVRVSDVWRKLGCVTDPELDESVTEMGFVTEVTIGGDGDVAVSFRLPTYWCSPNFAFMMGEDMRAKILELDWVRSARVVLGEHMYVDAINRGVNEGLSFREAFGEEATGNLDELRKTFLNKAFQWRQEALLSHLLNAGVAGSDVVGWTVGKLYDRETTIEAHDLIARYLDRRHIGGAFDDSSLAFVSIDGVPLSATALPAYLRSIRRLRTNAEFNGALCRRLLVERFSTEPLTGCHS